MNEPTPVKHLPELRRFEIYLDEERALLEYQRSGQTIRFTHTEVPKQFEGKGVGAKLVRAGLEYADSEGVNVEPACAFVAAYIRRHPEWTRLLAPDRKSGR